MTSVKTKPCKKSSIPCLYYLCKKNFILHRVRSIFSTYRSSGRSRKVSGSHSGSLDGRALLPASRKLPEGFRKSKRNPVDQPRKNGP